MEPLLVVVTMVSLGLAVGLAFVAWKLLRESRDRSLARMEALQALITSPADERDDADDDVVDELPAVVATPAIAVPATASIPEHTPLPALAPVAPAAMIAAADADAHHESWDLALRERRPTAPAPVTPATSPTRVRVRVTRSVRPEPTEDLFATPEQRTPSHRWTALAAVGVVMAIAIGGIYTAYSTDVFAAIAKLTSGRSGPATSNVGEPPLQLLSLRHATESNGEFVLTGLVQNPSTSPSLKGVVAVVHLFDREGRYFASGKATLDVPVLSSGAEAPFVIKVTATQPVGRYRVGFRQEDGAVVAHVDRRGELPGGTTGDVVEPAPVQTATPVSRRSEG